MKTLLSRFAKNESGATAIEYGLIAVLVGVAIIAGASALGTSLNGTFNDVSNNTALDGGATNPAAAAGGG